MLPPVGCLGRGGSAPRSSSGCANGAAAPELAARGWLPPRRTSALACDMIGRPGWRGVAVQMTPYLLHSRTLPHLYGTATSRCPMAKVSCGGHARKESSPSSQVNFNKDRTSTKTELQQRHNFIRFPVDLPSPRNKDSRMGFLSALAPYARVMPGPYQFRNGWPRRFERGNIRH